MLLNNMSTIGHVKILHYSYNAHLQLVNYGTTIGYKLNILTIILTIFSREYLNNSIYGHTTICRNRLANRM